MANNISCIIVDDEQDAIELLTARLNKLYKNITVLTTYSDWENALQGLRTQPCDLLFMDISMPGKNGIELLKLLPNMDSEIIFITAHEEYALNAFSFSTSGYILKPIADADLSQAVDKAIVRINNKYAARQAISPAGYVNDKIGIPNNHGIDYISINDIIFLESTNKCTKIVTAKGEYVSSLYLGKFQNLIDNHSFYQVHRSYIINLKSILRYESSGLVIMSNKKEIPISRNIKNDFLKLLSANY